MSKPDATDTIMEARSERMEQRIKPSVKRIIESAAKLIGSDTSDFVTMAAYREAVRTIEESRTIRLTLEDSKRFLDALEHPASPTEAMKAMMAEYEESVENAIR